MMTDDGKIGVRSNLLQLWVVFWLLLLIPCSAFAATTYDFSNLGTASGGFKPQGNRFLVSEAFRNDSDLLYSSAMYYGSSSSTISGMIIKADGVNLVSFDLNDMQFLANPGPLTIMSLKITATRSVGEPVNVTVPSHTLSGTGSTFKLSDLGIDLSSFTDVTLLQFDVTVNTNVLSLDFASITIDNEVHSPPAISTNFGAAAIPLGGTTSLTFTLSNPNSSGTLHGVAFSDTLPDGLIVASPPNLSNTCGGTATAAAGSSAVTLTGANLAPAASCSLTVNVNGTTGGEKINGTTVSSANGGTGNTASANLTVEAADMGVTINGDAVIAIPQNNITYTITLVNDGPTAAQNVNLTDTTPAHTTFKALSMGGGSGWSMNTPPIGGSGTITCSKASVASGESAIFLLTLQVGADVADGSIIGTTATVSALTPDPNPANNASTDGSTVAYPIRTGSTTLFPTFSAALDSVSSSGTVEAWGIEFQEKLTLHQGKTITLRGGYDTGFNKNSGVTTVAAPLAVAGTLTLEQMAVK